MVISEACLIIFNMDKFAGITEGITDQKVISNILIGFFNDRNITINWLQPPKIGKSGGYGEVFKYCRSRRFRKAFDDHEYVIIHIDSDISSRFNVFHQDENGKLLTPEQLIEKVIDKFRSDIGEDFYDQNASRIIFAIAVHSIECWLLPLCLPEKKAEIDDCMNILKRDLPNFQPKDHKYYQEISMEYANKSSLLKLYPENPSLKIFIEQLASKNIEISEES
jgi:hypothetical protein